MTIQVLKFIKKLIHETEIENQYINVYMNYSFEDFLFINNNKTISYTLKTILYKDLDFKNLKNTILWHLFDNPHKINNVLVINNAILKKIEIFYILLR